MPSRLMPPVSSVLRVGAVAAVCAAAAVVTVPRPASADQQSSVQAQISALRDQLTATGQQVHQLTAGYAAAEASVQSLAQQVAVDRVEAKRAAAAVAERAGALRQDLVAAYVGGFDQSSASAPAASTRGDVANPAVRYGYLSIATSSMRDSVDSYRTAQLALNTALSSLTAEERSAQAAADSASRARQAALDAASAANARLGALEAQLTALEDKAAAQRAAQARQQATPGAAPGGAVQGGPVNGGLVSLVRSQVGAPAAPVSSAAVPAPPVATTAPSTTAAPPPAPLAVPAITVAPTTAPPVTAPPTTAPPVTAAPVASPTSTSGSADVWLQLRECESGNDYQANTGNGFYGAYQFTQQTWTDLGYPGRPDQEPPAMQDQAAQKLQAESGWGQWPACSAALGLT